jgi:RNA polymerase sigma factor (TIGR02999 family)
MTDVTQILNAIEQGDERATHKLLPLVYEELRLLAAQKLSHEKPGQTLQATALVHEAYLRLTGDEPESWNGRGHFFAAAAEAMRRILVENARRKQSLKHGGDLMRIADLNVTEIAGDVNISPDDLIALDEILEKLAKEDPVLVNLVHLHCFAGLPLVQVAEIMGVSSRTAERYWAFAKAWLSQEMRGSTY